MSFSCFAVKLSLLLSVLKARLKIPCLRTVMVKLTSGHSSWPLLRWADVATEESNSAPGEAWKDVRSHSSIYPKKNVYYFCVKKFCKTKLYKKCVCQWIPSGITLGNPSCWCSFATLENKCSKVILKQSSKFVLSSLKDILIQIL